MRLDPAAVLEEVRKIDPLVVDLAAERVYRHRLEQQCDDLQRALADAASADEEDGDG